MRTSAASAPAGSPENERWRRRARRPTSAGWGRAAGCKAEPRAGERRVRLCCRGKSAPRRSAWRRNSRRRSPGRSTPCGAMPRRSVPLVRRLSEPRVRDSATVHAEHRSVPWPFSFPVPPKNIAGRRNHNARPVLRHSDTRRTAFNCGRNRITSTWGSSPSDYLRLSNSKIEDSNEGRHARVPSLFGVILVERIRANDTQRRPHSEGRDNLFQTARKLLILEWRDVRVDKGARLESDSTHAG